MPVTALRRILRTTLVAAAAGAVSLGVLPATQAHAATVSYKIAVLGDSWASGEGNSPYSDAHCDRSKDAWSFQVKLPDGNTVKEDKAAGTATVDFLACQGALTANLIDTPETVDGVTYPAQIKTMDTDYTHVFLSVSGNDLNFVGLLGGCYNNGPVTCGANVDSTRANLFPRALKGLRTVIEKIHARAPQAQIILTGYAALVGDDSGWGSTNVGLLNELAIEYEDAEFGVVQDMRKIGIDVDFVGLFDGFWNHSYGGPSSEWIFPPQIILSYPFIARHSLHPNGAGEIEIAKLASQYVEKPFSGSCSGNVISGADNNCVREIQAHLNSWATKTKTTGVDLTVDGKFGPATLAAVKLFQKAKKLTVDGDVGPITKKALFVY
jgi:lysophospholipase L1-like esterase